MSKKKNYMTLLLSYCRKHEIWFSVCTDSSLDTITYLKDGNYVDSQTSSRAKVGTKACYEWVKKEVKEIEDDLGDQP